MRKITFTQKRFFIIYISFFSCILAILIPLYYITLNILEKNMLRINEAVLSAGLQRLEDEIHRITVAADTLHNNKLIIPLTYMDSNINLDEAYQIQQATTYYNDITNMLNITSATGLILKNNFILASGRLHLNFNDFNSYFSDRNTSSYEEWFDSLKRENQTYSFTNTMVTTQNFTRDAVIFAVSLPLNTNWKNTFFYSVFDSNNICSILAIPDVLNNSTLTLYDASGVQLLDYKSGNISEYVTIVQKSEIYGLTAELKIDKKLFLDNLKGYYSIMKTLLFSCILIGIALSIIYSWKNAKPITNMLSAAALVSQKAGGDMMLLSQENFKNGYQYMDVFINQVDKKLRDNKLQLMYQESQLKENLFERLLRGEVYSESTFEMAHKYFPEFPEQCFMVMVKLLNTEELKPSTYSAKQIELKTILEPYLVPGSYIHFSADLILILQPCGNINVRIECGPLCESISKKIMYIADIDVRIAISVPFSGMSELNKVFQRLQNLLRFKGDDYRSTPIFQDDHMPTILMYDPVKQHSSRFYELLVHAERNMALALLNEDIELLKQSGMPSEIDIQQLFYIYRHALALAYAEIDPEVTIEIKLPVYNAHNSLNDTFNSIYKCLNQLCDIFEKNRQNSIDSFERTVISMIDKNLSNTDLYIRMVTEHFSISESTLQRIMHRVTGKSFLEYVDSKRMIQAKELLLSTDLPINQVMSRCGYATGNSFYKAFKRKFGISPSAMRNISDPAI